MAEKKTETPGVDPKLDRDVAKLTSQVESFSLHEKESERWKPQPPIDSALSRKEKEEELKKRRYSKSLIKHLLDPGKEIDKCIEEFEKHDHCYTYVLVNPMSHDGVDPEQIDFNEFIRGVFYIGKGSNGRGSNGGCAGHFFSSPEKSNPFADRIIFSIWEAGKTPAAVVCTQGDGTTEADHKKAIMIRAYGHDNISVKDYEKGMLANRQKGNEKSLNETSGNEKRKSLESMPREEALKREEEGVQFLLQAWKTYRNTDKSGCAARIMWPSNPKK